MNLNFKYMRLLFIIGILISLSSCETERQATIDCSCKYGKSLELFANRGDVKVHDYAVTKLDPTKPVSLTTINKNLVKGLSHDCLYGGWQGKTDGTERIVTEYITDDAIIGYWDE